MRGAARSGRRAGRRVALARFWEKRGYHREPSLKAVFFWRDRGDDAETAKPETFWMQRLEAPR